VALEGIEQIYMAVSSNANAFFTKTYLLTEYTTLSIKLNSLLAITSRSISLLLGFLIMPLLVNNIGTVQYGVWATLASVCSWLLFFDLGVGNSFKNTVAKGDLEEIEKEYNVAASLYVYISASFAVLLLFLGRVFESTQLFYGQVLMLYLPIVVFFPLKIFGHGIQGGGRVGVNSLIDSLRLVLFFLSLLVYFECFEYSLSGLIVIFVMSNLAPVMLQVVVYKNTVRSVVMPRLQSFSVIKKSEGFKLGIRFFSLQLSSLLLFSFGNILIYSFFSPDAVAMYDVCSKVFVAGLSLFNMVIAVVWPKLTLLYGERDYTGCIGLYFGLLKLAFVFCVGVSIVAINFDFVLAVLSLEGSILLQSNLLLSVAILTCLQAFSYCGAVVMNATGKLTTQIVVSFFSILLIIPLFLMFFQFDFGVASYSLASALLVAVGVAAYNLSALKIINGMR